MVARVTLPAKNAGEQITLLIDFSQFLLVGQTVSAGTCGCIVYSGVDASPSAVLNGSCTVSGTSLQQQVTGGVVGVIYLLTFTATITGTQHYIQEALLAIVTIGP